MAPKERASPAVQQAGCCECACSCGKRSQEPPALFVDDDFPARWHVLCHHAAAAAWLRPHELCAEPRLVKDGCSRFAVQQGYIGDCWFMAACAAVAECDRILQQVIPEGQVLFGPGYDGSVRFRLWHLGEWVEVRVDDRLPVDAHGVPVYARCQHKDEFWLPLLEKAFAKFHKHFGVIEGGRLSEGLINLTGYSMQVLKMEHWNVGNTDENFLRLKHAFDNGHLIVCAKYQCGPGLPAPHAYTVTKVYQRDPKKGEDVLQLIRVRNPWGSHDKWNGGPWKDGDERWAKLSKEEKEIIEYNPQDNGEFWMSMEDFKNNFEEVVIGTQQPVGAEEMKVVGQITGCWNKDQEVGGDHTEIETFAKNPQFSLVSLGCDDAEAGHVENPMEGMEAIVELVRGHRRNNSQYRMKIAFYVFEGSGEQRLSAEQLRALERVEGSTKLMREVAVSARLRLRPGRRYVVIPATERAGQEGTFLLRVFSRCARVRLSQLPPAPTPAPAPQPTAAT
ncbi:hypothetical protein R5R35_008078 [Gryllus longicercus]|uniref:Calpain catalytic domain-containing protein n=1 Tax=Gryllus longicercus TaxID=2509291 RepID=A0AAN9Z1R6_9ORTH